MKHILSLISILAFAAAARAEFTPVALTSGDNPLRTLPARAVAIQVASTNATGTLKLERITPLTVRWTVPEVVATTNYVDVTTNLYKTVTNNLVIAWRTRYLGNGVVESNEYARATNETPAYPSWTDIVVTTNKVVESESYTNWTYQVVGSVDIATNQAVRSTSKAWTNTIYNATLSGGIATNRLDAMLFPGEYLNASGTALSGGTATLIIER